MAGKAQNQRTEIGRIGRSLADDLNKLKPGLGTQLVREINQRLAVISTQFKAQAGHKGTVTIAKQTVKDVTGKMKPGILLEDDRVTGVALPVEGSDAVNLDYFRRFLDCDWFIQMAEDCLELPDIATGTTVPDCWRAEIE